MKLVPETTKDFGFLKIFDLYTQTELENIWREILYLDYVLNLTTDDDPLRGKQLDGSSKMSGEGLFVDHVYTNREYSPILTYNRRLFLDEEINKNIRSTHPANDVLYKEINRDFTLLNRYTNTQEYRPHTDKAAFTAITVLLHKPEQITGGDFIFPDYDISFGCKHNSCIIFPSWVKHSVCRVESIEDGRRYSIAQLMLVGEVL